MLRQKPYPGKESGKPGYDRVSRVKPEHGEIRIPGYISFIPYLRLGQLG
jgi:hypothetical protein